MTNLTVEGIYDARALGYPKMAVLGVQHLFAMFGATVLVPILTGLSISATLLFAGLGTLIFHFLTKRKVPAFLGSSFAFLPGYFALTAMQGGIWEGLTKTQLLAYASVGVAVSALVYLLVAAIVKGCGVQRVMKFFPPVVTGPIVIGIGLVLAPIAVGSASTCWPVALAGIVAVLVAACFGKGMVRIIPILIGVLVSYLAAVILGNGCGLQGASVDFSKIAAATVGGVSFVLYGMISSVGVRNLVEHQVDFSKARNMLICAVTIVCALGISFSESKGISFAVGSVSFTLSGLAVGALMGILLNAVLPGKDYVFDEVTDSSKDLKKPNPDNGIHN